MAYYRREKTRNSYYTYEITKILYYTQAYFIGMTGKTLFNNKIEAWTHGPVVPDVYSQYKKYGNDIITNIDNVKIPDELSALISMIIQDKRTLSAHELREATHREKPWQEACNKPDKIITNNMIAIYFSPQFWTSDEEDYYQPYFNSIDEEDKYIHSKITEEERNVISKQFLNKILLILFRILPHQQTLKSVKIINFILMC